MRRANPLLNRLLAVATVIATTSAVTAALAQEEEPEDVPVARFERQFDPRVFEQQLENWVFGHVGGAQAARRKLETNLSQRVEEIDQACRLSAAQKKKLEVAGRGEIKRFFDRVEAARSKIRTLEGPWDNARVNAIWQEAQPLQQAISASWFDDRSLFCKALHHTLSDEQAVQFEQAIRDRADFHFRAAVSWAVVLLASNLGWSDEQRQRFEKVLIEETRPPKKFHTNEFQVVLYLASRIPEEKIKPIFDDLQWRLLTLQFRQARSMEQWLKNGGFVPGDEPAAQRADVRIEIDHRH